MSRYPLAPLMAATGIPTMKALRAIFPMNGPDYRRVLDEGLSERQADRWAVKLGLHPGEVWADWFGPESTDLPTSPPCCPHATRTEVAA